MVKELDVQKIIFVIRVWILLWSSVIVATAMVDTRTSHVGYTVQLFVLTLDKLIDHMSVIERVARSLGTFFYLRPTA